MATEAVTTGGVPGLAAMEPDGKFVTVLNTTQEGQWTPQQTRLYAIVSHFEARLIGGEHEPKEFPRRLVLSLADGLVDRLMKKAPNDLVVDTPSMTCIDPHLGGFIRDTLDFGRNPHVYHLNYFTRPETANALARWLELAAPATPSSAVESGILAQRRIDSTIHMPSGITPAILDTDIFLTDASMPAAEAASAVMAAAPSYVVVRRPYENRVLNYAVPAEVFVRKTTSGASNQSVREALNLHEDQRTECRSVLSLPAKPSELFNRTPELVFAGDDLIGVLPPAGQTMIGEDLPKLAEQILRLNVPEDLIVARRVLPTFSGVQPRIGARAWTDTPPVTDTAHRGGVRRSGGIADALPEPGLGGAGVDGEADGSGKTPVTCHFRAEMPETVSVGDVASIEVSISREILGGVASATRQGSTSAAVDPTRNLVVQIVPKQNFEIVVKDRVEIPPLDPQDTKIFYFDVRATHNDGGEGEIWVVVRQGQIPVARLTLRPRIITERTVSSRQVVSEGDAAEAEPLAGPLTQLFITELINGSELRYKFQLQNPHLGLLAWDVSKPIRSNREQYVRQLYSEIENRWLSHKEDVANFYAELRAYGAELLEELVPVKIQKALWEHRDAIDSIMVIAEEPFIPWEVLHLIEPGQPVGPGTKFFGEMGLVRWLEEAGWPKTAMPFGSGRRR
jgi:hypothetical protein